MSLALLKESESSSKTVSAEVLSTASTVIWYFDRVSPEGPYCPINAAD
jgi:hypothetical protein